MKRSTLLGLWCFCLAARATVGPGEAWAGAADGQHPGPRLVEWRTEMGKIPSALESGWPFVVSPDLSHVAWVESRSKWGRFERVIFLDGEEVKRQKTDSAWLTFTPNSGQLMCSLGRLDAPHVSIIRIEGRQTRELEHAFFPSSSLDGAHIAYWVRREGKLIPVIDGVEGRQYEPDVEPSFVRFSPDGTRWAYRVGRGEHWSQAVVDGVAHAEYDRTFNVLLGRYDEPVFSHDGEHVAYFARRDGKYFIVLDGVEGSARYDGIRYLVFSAASSRLAVEAVRDGRFFFVVDGKEGKGWDAMLGVPVLSPDGSRSAYIAKTGGKSRVILDDVELPEYDQVLHDSLTFSPDGRRFAYIARNGRKWRVVLDGVDGKEYDEIVEGTFLFSPDSTRCAYAARDHKTRHLVVDGVETKQYDEFLKGGIAFSPDSKHVACAVRRHRSWLISLDGAETREFDSLLPVGPVFTGPRSLRFLSVRGWDGAAYLEVKSRSQGGTTLTGLIPAGPGGYKMIHTRPGTILRVDVDIEEE